MMEKKKLKRMFPAGFTGFVSLAALFCFLPPQAEADSGLTVLRRSDGRAERYAGRVAPGQVLIPSVYREPAAEMRGVWLTTMENIDFQRQTTDAGVQNWFQSIFRTLADRKFNAVFFQVRPCCDAFYVSRINPWSRYLTGVEGQSLPGRTDPLKVAIREAGRNGLKIYAWLNPYRVVGKTKLSKSRYLATLAPGNFARRNPRLVLSVPLPEGGNLLFLNPGEPEVIRHVADTVREIVEHYPVDGIVFDDYFYPYTAIGNADAACYVRNNPGKLSRSQWRTENVNRLIREVRRVLKQHAGKIGRQIPFGVSPFGIWANRKDRAEGSLTAGKSSLLTQYADTRSWVRNNEIDFIIPQIYWNFGHETAAYAALTDWWVRQVRGTRVKLYIGMSSYRLGEGGGWRNASELLNQLRYNTRYPEISGQLFFNMRSVLHPANAAQKNAMQLLRTRYWKTRVPVSRPASSRRYPAMR